MTAARTAPAPSMPLAELLERWSFEDSEGPIWQELCERALLDPLSDFLGRPSKMLRARLVDLGFFLAGGAAGALPPELPLVIEALHAGSLIVDDIEDGSWTRRGAETLHHRYGVPVALNAGNWLYFWPQVLLSRAPLAPFVRLRCHERLVRCLLRCHEGQAVDLTARVCDLARPDVRAVVRAITERKTAGLLELATVLGALAAGSDGPMVDAIATFGREVGIALQMLDDLSGVLSVGRRHKAIEDLQQLRATWVWAWLAEDLDVPTYARMLERLGEVAGRGKADALIDAIRAHLGPEPLRRARLQIDKAIAALRAAGGDDAWCHEVRGELARLENLYVHG
jgi:geranylgeranyl pyrophosphate synthase